MATTAETATEEKGLTLTPPDPVPTVAPAKAAGLVPVDDKVRTQLEEKVDGFVAELVAQDVNSPEFGRRVDAITAMGQKEIREAASQSNRFLDRPVKAMDGETGVGKDLTELRRVVESLDPGKQGNLSAPRKLLGILPFGNKMRDYFDGYRSSQTHIAAILKPRGTVDGQCRDRHRTRQSLVRHGPAGADDPSVQDDGRAAGGQGQ